MKSHLAFGIFSMALLFIKDPVIAQTKTAPAAIRSYEEILKAIPRQDFLKLRGNDKKEVALQLSKTLSANEVEKNGAFAIQISRVDPWTFTDEGFIGSRIVAEDEKIRMGSIPVALNVFVHIHAKPTPAIEKLKRGDKIIVTGKVTRCDLIAVDSPTLVIDIHSDSLTPVAK